jgi:hypothetical protein
MTKSHDKSHGLTLRNNNVKHYFLMIISSLYPTHTIICKVNQTVNFKHRFNNKHQGDFQMSRKDGNLLVDW